MPEEATTAAQRLQEKAQAIAANRGTLI